MATLPPFSELWANYPHGSAEAAKATIGGNVDMDWITNTCVVRVAHAMNLAGAPIPRSHAGLNTARGGNGMRYAYRVSEFKEYMEHEYGGPTTKVVGGRASAFAGQQGIICFEVGIWSDATGHFDLWNGSECAHKAYFSEASEVMLWAC